MISLCWNKVILVLFIAVVAHGWITPSSRKSGHTLFMSSSVPDLTGKRIYQRLIYRLSEESSVDNTNFSVEERVRFHPSPEGDGSMEAFGRRTLILREDEKEVYRMDVHEAYETHAGIGTEGGIESAICTILYLASNPQLLVGNVMDLNCDLGLAGLLGSIAAGFALGKDASSQSGEIGLLSQASKSPVPKDMESMTLVDKNEDTVNLAFANAKHSGVPSSKVSVEEQDFSRRRVYKKYHTILASDVYLSYPTAKDMARTVAYSLEPLPWQPSGPAPRLVFVYRENDEDVTYLKQFITRGYLMATDVEYLGLEKHFLRPSIVDADLSEEDAINDSVEVQRVSHSSFECLTALHSPEYSGENGDYLFPLENGAYEGGSSGTSSLEREWDRRSPW